MSEDRTNEPDDFPLRVECCGLVLWALIGCSLAAALAFGWGSGR